MLFVRKEKNDKESRGKMTLAARTVCPAQVAYDHLYEVKGENLHEYSIPMIPTEVAELRYVFLNKARTREEESEGEREKKIRICSSLTAVFMKSRDLKSLRTVHRLVPP